MRKLIITGLGVKDVSHLTVEVQSHIKNSEIVIYSTYNPIMEYWIAKNSKKSVSLDSMYCKYDSLEDTYKNMTSFVQNKLDEFNYVVFAVYGHPNVFVKPTKMLVDAIKSDDVAITVLPGISSLDCLLSDLMIDPLYLGCQIYDATFYLNNEVIINSQCPLVLMQIGLINSTQNKCTKGYDAEVSKLLEKLLVLFEKERQVKLYISSETSLEKPLIESFSLGQLIDKSSLISKKATLFIP